MDIDIILLTVSIVSLIVTIVYVSLIYFTLRTNKEINKKILFNAIVNQERMNGANINEYRDVIHSENSSDAQKENAKGDYDTFLFNFYEYLALCVSQKFVDEKVAMVFFREYLKSVKELFDKSVLFKGGYAEAEQYKGLLWLFKRWNVQ